MDLQTGERLLPWDPIPRESNVYMEVGVCRVEEFATTEGTPVAIILVAPQRDAGTGAWRLLFQCVSAYRRLPVEAHASAQHIALRQAYEKRSLPTPATYEVVRSRWLQKAVSPNYAHPRAVRHFVIADSDEVYDIAAEWCDVQELGDAEQACMDMQIAAPGDGE